MLVINKKIDDKFKTKEISKERVREPDGMTRGNEQRRSWSKGKPLLK